MYRVTVPSFRVATQCSFQQQVRKATTTFFTPHHQPATTTMAAFLQVAGAVAFGAGAAFTYSNVTASVEEGGGDRVAYCKPIDTPEYLIPFHLRSIRSRFNHYASIRKKGGVRYMTTEDFVCAILAKSETTLSSPHAANDLKKLFTAVDSNGDGILSLSEFSFLVTLLATKKEDFKIAFKMFDQSAKKNSSLDLTEFTKMITTIGDSNTTVDIKNGLVQKLFGANGNKRCSADSLLSTVDDLKMEIWKAEFRQYDTENIGAIEPEEFGELIASHLVGTHLPFYLVGNLRKLKEESRGKVGFSSWVSFSKMLENADIIGQAIEVYTSSGKPLLREDFNRAVVSAGLPKLAALELDLIFTLFDNNGDGALEYDEFLSIMKKRVSFHVKSKIDEKVRSSLYSQFAKCSSEALF